MKRSGIRGEPCHDRPVFRCAAYGLLTLYAKARTDNLTGPLLDEWLMGRSDLPR